MTDAIKQAQDAYDAARRAQEDLERVRDEEAREAAHAVKLAYTDRVRAAGDAKAGAYRLLREAQEAGVTDHEWEGKIVRLVEPICDRWFGQPLPGLEPDITRAMLYTFRPSHRSLGLTGDWHIKNMGPGAVYLRPLKKDGTPGLRAIRMTSGRGGAEWKLEEGQ